MQKIQAAAASREKHKAGELPLVWPLLPGHDALPLSISDLPNGRWAGPLTEQVLDVEQPIFSFEPRRLLYPSGFVVDMDAIGPVLGSIGVLEVDYTREAADAVFEWRKKYGNHPLRALTFRPIAKKRTP